MLRHTQQQALQIAERAVHTVTGFELTHVLGRLEDRTKNRVNVGIMQYPATDGTSLNLVGRGVQPRPIVASLELLGVARVFGIAVKAELQVGAAEIGEGLRETRVMKLGVTAVGGSEKRVGILKLIPGLQRSIALRALRQATGMAPSGFWRREAIQVSGSITFDGTSRPLCPYPVKATAS
jgi:hypothetical protein